MTEDSQESNERRDTADWNHPDFWDKSRLVERGEETISRVGDLGIAAQLDELAAFDVGMAHYVIQFMFGEVFSRPGLDDATRLLCVLAAVLTDGDEAAVEATIRSALKAGAAREQVVAVVLQTGCFSGFYKWQVGARAGLRVFRELGLPDATPGGHTWRNPTQWDQRGLWERGWQVRDEISGGPGTPSVMPQQAEFDPLLPHYVIEFRFGEVTARPGLDAVTRQLCTLATFLATGEEFAAEGAMKGALNVGATPAQIVEVVIQTGTLCGFPKWAIGSRVGVKVFHERGLIPASDPSGRT